MSSTADMPLEAIGEAFLQICGYPPRSADLQTLELLGKSPEDVADFIWDHHLGEPEHPTEAEVLAKCNELAAAHGAQMF